MQHYYGKPLVFLGSLLALRSSFALRALLVLFLSMLLILPDHARATEAAKVIVSAPKEGVEYKVLQTPAMPGGKGKDVLVQEFFSYQCGHCYEFNDDLQRWEKNLPANVKVVQVPVAFNESMKSQALLFYTLQSLKMKNLSLSVFDAIQRKGEALNTKDEFIRFMKHHRVSSEKFKEAYNSIGVARQAEEAYDLMMKARLHAIPAILIDGRYLTNPQMAGGPEKMLKVAEYLINKSAQDK